MHGSHGRRSNAGGTAVDLAGAQQIAVPRGQWQRDTWSTGHSTATARREHDGSGTAVCLQLSFLMSSPVS